MALFESGIQRFSAKNAKAKRIRPLRIGGDSRDRIEARIEGEATLLIRNCTQCCRVLTLFSRDGDAAERFICSLFVPIPASMSSRNAALPRILRAHIPLQRSEFHRVSATGTKTNDRFSVRPPGSLARRTSSSDLVTPKASRRTSKRIGALVGNRDCFCSQCRIAVTAHVPVKSSRHSALESHGILSPS